MAYIPGFEHDIFISYAHLDNIPLSNEERGWINKFYDDLKLMLTKRCGRSGMLNIWWDSKRLDGAVKFDDSIAKGIDNSAVMICLNSTSYKESPYCNKELDHFYKKASTDKGLMIGEHSRIVHVLLENIPFREWPEELSGMSGFPFYEAEDDDLGDAIDTDKKKFTKQLRSLRNAVWAILDNFHDNQLKANTLEKQVEQKIQVKEEGNIPEDAFCVYLAEVSDCLRSTRKRLIAELEKDGYHIVLGGPPPDEATAHEVATKEALQKTRLSVHLLDHISGREILDDSNSWYPMRQVEIALKEDIPQVIWMPQDTDYDEIEEEAYKNFLLELEAGKVSEKKYDFIKGMKGDLVEVIIGHIEEIKNQRFDDGKGYKTIDQGPLSVLLDYHTNDINFGRDICNTLTENQITAYFAPSEEDPAHNNEKYRNRLMDSKKFVFLYGDVENDWINERVKSTLKKLIEYDRFDKDIYDDILIYMTPPFKDDSMINLPVKIFNNSNEQHLEDQLLKEFLQDLKSVQE